jgi:hypothetical protein
MECCQMNPGSAGHPFGCKKPCNKFVQGKPGSCKHGNACNFCHEQHDRPSLRSRASQHHENKERFLRNAKDLPPGEAALFDLIYSEPRKYVEEVLEELRTLQQPTASNLMNAVQNMIQMMEIRVDALRLLHLGRRNAQRINDGAVIASSEASVMSQLLSLEGRLHAVAKQWLAAGRDSDEILQKIKTSLNLEEMVAMVKQRGRSSL